MTDLWRLSAHEIAGLVRRRKVSAVEVTRSALARLDEANPAINAVVQEMPEAALRTAKTVDATVQRGDDPGVLAGVPVTVKVNVDQAGFATTNGLRTQRDLIASADNPVVANMKAAGAIVIGRTNTPAFSLRWFTRNSLHGHTRNPHNAGITPGGSSGGAGAATASGIGAIGHGTDIAGSIRYPAYACGIHGLRPSLGRVPAVNLAAPDRHIGAQIMAVSGPLARCVADVRLGLEAMASEDVRDPWWVPVPLKLAPQPKRAALCVAPSKMDVAPAVETALRQAARTLGDAGWEVIETEAPDMRAPARLQANLWLAEFRRTAASALAAENDPDANFIYQQMERHCPEPDLNGVLDTLQERATLSRVWQQFLQDFPVLLCPVSGQLPFADQYDVETPQTFDEVFEAMLPQIATPFIGLPGMSVATGMGAAGVPVGVQLIGGRFREDTLLDAAEAIETGYDAVCPVDPKS